MYDSLFRASLWAFAPALFLVWLGASPASVWPMAQPHGPAQDQLTRILEAAKQQQRQIENFAADFAYTLSFPNERHMPLKGSIIYQKGQYIVMLPDQHVYCDGSARWYHLIDQREVIVKDYEPEIGITMPFQVLFKGLEPRYEGTEAVNGQSCNVVFFNALKASSYQKAKVWIDQESHLVRKLVLYFERNGTYTFVFSNISLNQTYPNTTFNFPFEKFPGLSVIDERIEK